MRKIKHKHIWCLPFTVLIILFIIVDANAQRPKLFFDHYNVKDGLPEASVRALIQDDQGYVWIGTQNGLVRYNGYDFKVYKPNPNDSLGYSPSGRNILNLLQSQDGKIWAGTVFNGGLICFDPNTEKFTNYYRGREKTSAHQFDSFELLKEDAKGRIWVRAFDFERDSSRLEYLNPKSGTFTTVPVVVANNLNPDLFGSAIAEDIHGNIWLGDLQKGLFKYEEEKDTVAAYFPFILDTLEGGKTPTIKHLMIDNQQRMWVATTNGLHQIQLTTGEGKAFSQSVGHSTFLSKDTVAYTYQDQQDQIWVSSSKRGLYLFQENTKTFSKYTLGIEPLSITIDQKGLYGIIPIAERDNGIWFIVSHRTTPYYLFYHRQQNRFTIYDATFNNSDNQTNDRRVSYLVGEDNLLWIGNSHRGFNRQNPTLQRIDHFQHDPSTANSLSHNTILHLFEDSNGTIWIATWSGLSKFIPSTQSFERYELEGEGNKFFTQIMEDSKQRLWVGSAQGLLFYDSENNRFVPYLEDFITNTNSASNVSPRAEDQNGHLWLTCWGRGIAVFDPDTKKLVREYTNENSDLSLEFTFPWQNISDSKGRVWAATSKALLKFDIETDTFISYLPNPDDPTALSNDEIQFVMEDTKGRIWIGTDEGGLNLYLDSIDGFRHWQLPHSFSSISKGLEDSKGNLWFGTYSGGGLHKFDPEKEEFSIYGEAEGLLSNNIQEIVEDDLGYLWLPSERGLSRFDPLSESFQHFYETDGFQPDLYGWFLPNTLKTSTGEIWMGRTKGVHRFHPKELINPSSSPPKVWITELQIGDRTYSQADGDLLEHHISVTESIQLNHAQNNLTLHFEALHYARSADNQYSYILENSDDKWSDPATNRSVRYTNLSPGTYTFKVKASNADGVWTEEEKTLQILIDPPWWQTWWAYALYVLVAYALIYWYIQRLRKKLDKERALNLQLTTTNQRLADLNIANSRFVPNDFLQLLDKQSILDLQLGDQIAAKMTILFADIRDYTGLSEQMTPEENFKFINAYLGRVGPIIKKHGGFISQYFGDGVMALFKDHHQGAVHASIEIQQTINRYNQTRLEKNKSPFRVGIGLNTGGLMLGVIGDKSRYDTSVISDAVNTASRMEGLTKIFGCMLIISETTKKELLGDSLEENLSFRKANKEADSLKDSPSYAYRFLGKVKVKGKQQAINIYDFFDGDPATLRQLKLATKEHFEKALTYYFNKEFGKTSDLLKVVLDKFPQDQAAQYYFDKTLRFVTQGVDATWSGVEEMISK